MVTINEHDESAFYVESLKKEFKIKSYTRAIARAYDAALFKGVVVRAGGEMDTPAINGSKAEEEMVRLLFDMSIQEMDDIDNSEYLELKKIVEKRQLQKKSESVESSETSNDISPEIVTQ